MRCVVTGGAGFIGSHLVDRLVGEGHDVVVIDDFATGRRENLAQHAGSKSVTVIEADVADGRAVAPAVEGADWVFHLAGLADIVPSIEKPLAYHRANVDGTVSILEASRAARVKRFVYAASSSCYGIPDAYPTGETAPMRPMYPYAFTKLAGESYALHWGRVYGLPVVSLRLFNVYGPRSRTTGAYGAVFGVFLAQKLAGKPYTVVGDGTQSRDFTFVTDVADAFARAAASDVTGEAMNVGTGRPQTVSRLVELLGGEVTHLPRRPGEPDCTQADVTKIRTLLGWEARVPFERGVEAMLAHIDLWRDAPVWTPESIAMATRAWFERLGKDGRGAS
jgi:UDP-glucose 4-epimerase